MGCFVGVASISGVAFARKEGLAMHHDTPTMAPIYSTQRTVWGAIACIGWALTSTGIQAQIPVLPAATLAAPTDHQATPQPAPPQGILTTELTPNAPDSYTIKSGDTLWGIAGLYLRSPWRWPVLWGMNRQDIANPHLIFPGQTLYLDRQGGYARLGTQRPQPRTETSASTRVNTEPLTVRVSPRTRSNSLADTALPTLKPHLIEPFLVEPQVVDEQTLLQAPRIVATVEDRVLMSTGDRAYARSDIANPLRTDYGEPRQYQVFRNAVPLKDPTNGEILGYEAQYVGRAELVRGESIEDSLDAQGGLSADYIPATFDIIATREEIRAGDRLLPAPARAFVSYMPHAPKIEIDARVVSIYGGAAFANAAQNQVIAISRGEQDGIEIGHVLHLMTKGERIQDTTDTSRSMIKLPSENNGMVMIFRIFERVAYGLILDIRTPVKVGDRLVNPH